MTISVLPESAATTNGTVAKPPRARRKAPAIKAEPQSQPPVDPKPQAPAVETLSAPCLGLECELIHKANAWRFRTTADSAKGLLMLVRLEGLQSAAKRNQAKPPTECNLIQGLTAAAQCSHDPLTVKDKDGNRFTIVPAQFVRSAVKRSDLASGRMTFVG